MAPKKNKACTLKVGQIEKNPILTLGTSAKEVEKHARVAKFYGSVAPAIVGHSGGAYRVLAGQAGLEACARQGIREIPAVVTEVSGEAEQMKLALLLSTVRGDGCALSEGAFIDALITRHGVDRRELTVLLKKSKSWISKRQALAIKLSADVKEMVKAGVICARTAEEIAKLPPEVQSSFAGIAAGDSLSKTNIAQLVKLYRREDTGEALREAILNQPLTVLGATVTGGIQKRKEKRGLPERISSAAGFLVRLADELGGWLTIADEQSLNMAMYNLERLYMAMADLKTTMDIWRAGVSPGKPRDLGGEQR